MEPNTENFILDFKADNQPAWESIDDRIMGGASQSTPEFIGDIGMRFSGQVSLENNGGFASIRSVEGSYDISSYSGLILRVRGDGKRYKISLRTDLFFDGVSYQTTFTTEAGQWQEVTLPFEEFIPTHHGIKLTTVAPMDTSSVKSFGLFIADRQEGPFQLEIEWVKGT